ncbi:MAG: CBS domain-containing protein [Verrucomicrobiales bacterium]|nr:CBS domain-containing protein [Verrucomicrobiales bacterium]
MQTLATVDAILHQKGAEVYAIPPDATVFEALKTLRAKNVGALLVMRDDRLVGIVSERDYARKVAIEGRDSRTTPVSDIVTSAVHTVTRETTIQDCMELMSEHRVRHLPVLEESRVIGVISVGDLVKWIIQAQSATIDQLQSYISGQYPS